MSARAWDAEVLQRLVPDFNAFVEHAERPYIRSREGYVLAFKAIVEASPDYRHEVIFASADVNDRSGVAVVWMKLKIFGHPVNIQRECVAIFYWRRVQGVWACYKQTGLRGMEMVADLTVQGD